jgi:hypothetical protein
MLINYNSQSIIYKYSKNSFQCSYFYVVFFPRVGGLTLDSHHGSVVEYGEHMDIELGRC